MSSVAAVSARPRGGAAIRFFRTPKGLLILLLGGIAALAAWGSGPALVAPGLALGVFVAMAVDAPILRLREGHWSFPSGALLTGLIVAMVLSPREPWHVVAATSAGAILSKYLFRTHNTNIFNPAALALVVTFYVFHPGQDWWGSMPDVAPISLAALGAAGLYITNRVGKVPLLLAFLGSYFLLCTAAAYIGSPASVAAFFRGPDLHAVLYFAFFMVTDPPTSPPRHSDQILYGAIVAVCSFAIFELHGGACYLLAGLLIANLWEAWRRYRARASRPQRHHQQSQ